MIEEYLKDHNWEKKENIFQKRNIVLGDITPINQSFINLGKSRNIIPIELANKLKEYFIGIGYQIKPAANVVNSSQDTLFIGAGIQTFFNSLSKKDISDTPYYIAQPSIRTNSFSKVGSNLGFSSSFVNVCTTDIFSTQTKHVEHIDNWLNFLSNAGLYVGHMSLEEYSIDWNTEEKTKGQALALYYGNLRIGEFIYLNVISELFDKSINVSDIGFGLERLSWAINKNKDYFSIIGPLSSSMSGIAKDSLRTLTLMTINGLVPGSRAASYRMKQLLKTYCENSSDIHPIFEIQEYLNFWKFFTEFYDSNQLISKNIQKYISNQKIADFCNANSISFPKTDLSCEDFARELIFNKNFDLYLRFIEQNDSKTK